MANKQRDIGKEAQWRGVLKRYSVSGLSVREFCRQENLTEASFYAWRRTIRERDGNGETVAPAFVPAVVTGESAQDVTIAIELSGGCTLRLPEAISASRLAEFVHALESRGER